METTKHSSMDLDAPLSPHIASLIKSFSLVPPTAVPAIIDCVLASSDLSPSQLFSSLLHSLPQSDHILPHTSALCHLVHGTQDPTDSLRLLIWRVFVPTLKAIGADDVELVSQIERDLIDVVSNMQSWDLMEETLVPYCLRSVGLSVGMVQNDELAIYKWSREDLSMFSGTLPLPIACRVLTLLLDFGLRGKEIQKEQNLEGFVANLLWDLSNMSLGILMRFPESRSFSVRLLLPTIFKLFILFHSVEVFVLGASNVLSRLCFAKKIWECCLYLFSCGHLERLDAYTVLSLYFSSFHNSKLHGNLASCYICDEFDLRAEKEFWEEIRRGLVDKDVCLRKQALHILKVSLRGYSSRLHSDGCDSASESKSNSVDDLTISFNGNSSNATLTKRDRWAEEEAKSLGVGELCHLTDGYFNSHEKWKVFLLLYEMLEEYGTHLVEAAWTHQISLLFQSWCVEDHMNPVLHEVCGVQMETVEGISGWLAVLWERGFFHGNPQVRCLIMQSFLSFDWGKYETCAQKVPRSFVLGPLILGLNDVVHHRDFGVKGIYTSSTIQSASKFFGEYCCQMSPSERADFVWSLASLVKQEAFGRSGLMALAFCIAWAACKPGTHNMKEKQYSVGSEVEFSEFSQDLSPSRASDLLDVLGIVIEKSKQHFNSNYRLQVCEQVIKAAASVININIVSLDMLLQFLSAIPREFTDGSGSLREKLEEWLTQSNNLVEGFGSYDTKELFMKNLVNFPVGFLTDKYSSDDSLSFDDEDEDAWRLEAERWARVLFLVIKEAQHLEPIIKTLQNYSCNLSKEDCSVNLVSFKLLILILTLVEELQTEWRKFASYGEAKVGREFNRTRNLVNSSLLVTSADREKFVGQFSLIMEEVLSFSKLVSPLFWSVNMMIDTQLPCSIKGKLGGPSQRRLASGTSSSLLQAIMSIRTLVCISSWFAQLKGDDNCDSAFTFLWEFSWKIIGHRPYDSETAAELCLGGYEALVYVFDAWSKTFTLSAFDFMESYNKSHFPDGENMPLLDALLLNFLCNINDILDKGRLTRSRRAVLMNWKWHCLDSLLSIPFNVFENGVKIRRAKSFFSDSSLKIAFADIVESLENASETSVLYILRSVRSVVTLLCSVNTTPAISTGVTIEMMQQLVHSSWILHLSCNKRRVAPIAALLSAVLHQYVFSDLRMHETSGCQQGPLKWFIEKLLDEGVKSPRTIRLAALHLMGLWLSYPKTVKYYIKELKLLSLYGSVAFDEDFESELFDNHEARTEVSLLAQSPDRELTEVFINTELYARVCVSVLFYELAILANMKGEQKTEESLAAGHCGKLFLLELLDSAVNDKDLAKELYKKYSAVHRRKVRVWQMICILSNFVESDIVEEVMHNVHICLYRNNLPAVRQYLETCAIQVYLKFPSLAEKQLIPIFCDYGMRPQALSSYVFIAANVILHAKELTDQKKHLNELVPPIIPFLTSHHHSLRGFTQLLVHYVLCKLWPILVPDNSNAPLERKCFENLKSYLSENVDCTRLRTSMEGFLDAFDPNTSVSPAGVFSARNEGSEFECAPICLMDQVITFLNDARDDLRSSIAKDAVTIENEKLVLPDACKEMVDVEDGDRKRESLRTSDDLSLDFQKKITIHEHVRQAENPRSNCFISNSEFSRFLSEIEKEDQLLSPAVQSRIQAMAKIRESQQQFILVASLIDRIPNLAGLARTCEIFKAAGLAVSSASIVQDKQFQLISVTAEKWVPIIEVPVNNMKVFLKKKRREGFSILGLEQTANSTPLDKFNFPKKTVLVLGREKVGIPVEIIHILDACIEIPQLGIIRSLNVHVSGAVALWEYTRQQRFT